MRHYPEYKNSQLGWVVEIPKHWAVIKFHYLSQESKRKNDDDIDRDMLSLSSYTGIQVKQYEYENTKRSKEESLTYFVVEPNQLVVNPMWQIQRGIGVSYLHGIVSPGYRVYYIDLERLIPQYLHYLMRSDIYVDEYNKHIRGLTTYDRSVKKEDFENIGVLLPPKQEQTQIANFLDRKTEQIDEFIRIKERQIELLQEQRTTLINQVVTRGLGPNVEVRPSGVDWIGEVPKHWKVIKFRYLSQESKRKNDDDIDRDMLSLSSYTGIQVKQYEYENTKRSKEESLTYFVVEPNQLVVNPMWQIRRGIGVSYLHGIVSPGYRVSYINLERLIPQYLHYLMRSDIYVDEYNKHIRGLTTYDRSVKKEDFEDIGVLLPPKQEQTQIVDFLDCKTEQIDELIAAEQRKVELLKEYRQSFISEAVTGKIDVQNEV